MRQDKKTSVFELTPRELSDCLSKWGEPTYRANQIWHALYRELVVSFDDISNLPKRLRHRLSDRFHFNNISLESDLYSANGGSRKTVFRLADDSQIEAVLMRYQGRLTACISTQVGCAMACVFCATGQMGLGRNLTAAEIMEQALWFARELRSESKRLTNVVFMGMGEPFHNYHATVAAIDRMTDPDGFNLGARRITVSTVGLVPMILRFAQEKRREKLAISLHAATDELRSKLVPINKRYPLAELIAACHEYLAIVRRRITFEWVLIRGINDTPAQAKELINLVGGMLCHVNVIPLNQTQNYDGAPTTIEMARNFVNLLDEANISSTIRMPRGNDIKAACGQLRSRAV